MRETVSSSTFAAQTAPSPAAIALRVDADRDLRDEIVRRGVDHADGVRRDGVEAAAGVAREQEPECRCRRQSEHHRAEDPLEALVCRRRCCLDEAERGARRGDELARRPVPPLRLLREGARQHRVDVPRQLGPNLARPPRLLVHVRPEQGDVGRPRERRLPGQALVEDAGERVDVRARVDVVARDLLGRDVLERADDVTGSRDAAERAGPLREAEVGEVAVLLARGDGDQDVRRLDVAMDEPLLVRCVQGLRDLLEQRDRAGGLERPSREMSCARSVPST